MWFVYQDATSDLRRKLVTVLTTLRIHPVTHRHVSSPNLMCPGQQHAGTQSAAQSQRGIMSRQHMPTHCIVYTVHLTWNKVDDTTLSKPVPRQKSHCEPHFSTHWWDRLTLQHTEGEVWVWQPATIISSCHYLPSHSQLCSQRQMHKHCMQAYTQT